VNITEDPKQIKKFILEQNTREDVNMIKGKQLARNNTVALLGNLQSYVKKESLPYEEITQSSNSNDSS